MSNNDVINSKIKNLFFFKKYIEKQENKILKILYKNKKQFLYNLIIEKTIHKIDTKKQIYSKTLLSSICKKKFVLNKENISFKSVCLKKSKLWIQLSDNRGWIIY